MDGSLQLRVLDGTPPVHFNGTPVRGIVAVDGVATLEIGAIRVFITPSGSTGASGQNSDSTIRIVHPASPRSPQFTDPDDFDMTGRIVYQLPDAE